MLRLRPVRSARILQSGRRPDQRKRLVPTLYCQAGVKIPRPRRSALQSLELGAERARRVSAKHCHLAREEVKLLHGELDRPLAGMAFDIGVEHGGVERAFELVGL